MPPVRAIVSPRLAALLLVAGSFAGPVRADGEPLRRVIDARIRAAWEREKVTPAEPARDAEFATSVDDNGPAADAVWALITSSEFRVNHGNTGRPRRGAKRHKRACREPET